MTVYAIPGTKEYIESDSMPLHKLHPSEGGFCDCKKSESINYISMNGLPPSPDHYAIAGEWLTPDQFMNA